MGGWEVGLTERPPLPIMDHVNRDFYIPRSVRLVEVVAWKAVGPLWEESIFFSET